VNLETSTWDETMKTTNTTTNTRALAATIKRAAAIAHERERTLKLRLRGSVELPAGLALALEREAENRGFDLQTYVISVLLAKGLPKAETQAILRNKEMLLA